MMGKDKRNSGLVRVFEFSRNDWKLLGDVEGENHGDTFGGSIALSDDGLTLAAGATNNDSTGNSSGSVRIFSYNGNNNGQWTQTGRDLDGVAGSDLFGTSVALSADGKVVAAGAVGNDDHKFSSGHVRVFTRGDM